jgi:hypothetical protein
MEGRTKIGDIDNSDEAADEMRRGAILGCLRPGAGFVRYRVQAFMKA